MSYLVLARKYRPQSFEDLVGQEHVATTLANAIAQDRVAHAFLFTGVRGVGKTTSARILAKCLNCLGADAKETGQAAKGPTATPCQVCAACTEIAAGVDMDVQEIDGASYNGVDEVRRLQEGLAFRPARDRFKIYIVDEVHMLSTAAWNAFLKTLEEPPPHVKFIFATTEVHKVPVTILSRCQRYDFKLVSARQIGARIRDVLGRENLAADDDAVAVLAREAAGSMRDAMSLVDQVIAYGGSKIASEDVTRVLGVADREVMNRLTGAMLGGDAASALGVLHDVSRQGFDLGHLCRDLLRHARNLVVARVCPEAQARELMDLTDEEASDVIELAKKYEPDDLTRVFTGLSRAFDEIVKSGQVRAVLEMTVVRLARRPPLLPLDELLARLGELEKRLATGAPPPTRGGGGGGGRPTSTQASATSSMDLGGDRAWSPEAPSSLPSPGAFAPPSPVRASAPEVSNGAVGAVRGALALAAEPVQHRPEPPESGPAPRSAPEPSPAPPPVAAAAPAWSAPPPNSRSAPPPPPPPPAAPRASVPPPAVSVAVAESETTATWRKLVDLVRVVSPSVSASLELAVPVTVTPERLVIAFENESFEDARAEQTDARSVLAEQARSFFGVPTEVSFEIAASGSKIASVAYLDAAKRKQALVDARIAVEKHELVQRAIVLFDAELRTITLPAQED